MPIIKVTDANHQGHRCQPELVGKNRDGSLLSNASPRPLQKQPGFTRLAIKCRSEIQPLINASLAGGAMYVDHGRWWKDVRCGNIEIDTQRTKPLKFACSMLGINFQTYYPPMVEAIQRANPMVLSPKKNHQNKKNRIRQLGCPGTEVVVKG